MEIIKIHTLTTIPNLSLAIACIGYFDGFHRGHMDLFEEVFALAKTTNHVPSCICFDEDPWIILQKDCNHAHLTPFKKRMEHLEKMGIKRCYLLHFDHLMMKMEQSLFIENILNQLHLHTLICGEDFHFGKNGKGTTIDLEKGSFNVCVIQQRNAGGQKISSSTIESFLLQGMIEQANQLLDRCYTMEGVVVHGQKLGKAQLGFPTANLQPTYPYIIPKKGVYIGQACIHQKVYKAVINIGHNPTVHFTNKISIEGYLLDFDEEIYGETIIFSFQKLIRDEKKFENRDELITQLHKDVHETMIYEGAYKYEASFI